MIAAIAHKTRPLAYPAAVGHAHRPDNLLEDCAAVPVGFYGMAHRRKAFDPIAGIGRFDLTLHAPNCAHMPGIPAPAGFVQPGRDQMKPRASSNPRTTTVGASR